MLPSLRTSRDAGGMRARRILLRIGHFRRVRFQPPRLPRVSAVGRIVLVARLKAGERERAEKLLAHAVEPIVPDAVRWLIFLPDSEVVFLFEGRGTRESVLATLDDPVMSTDLAPWLPLFDGPLQRAYEARSWERSASNHRSGRAPNTIRRAAPDEARAGRSCLIIDQNGLRYAGTVGTSEFCSAPCNHGEPYGWIRDPGRRQNSVPACKSLISGA
jgi:hypothetical protein